jgi:hypothetical protein
MKSQSNYQISTGDFKKSPLGSSGVSMLLGAFANVLGPARFRKKVKVK